MSDKNDSNTDLYLNKIDPSIQSMYYYKVTDKSDELIIDFPLNSNIDPSLIKVDFSTKSLVISIYLPGKLPFYTGQLKNSVKSWQAKTIQKSFVVTFHKKKKGLWTNPIIDPNPETDEIDPQNCFNIGMIYEDISDIKKSADMGYIQALMILGYTQLKVETEEAQEFGDKCFKEAIDVYDSDEALISYADFLLSRNISPTYAMHLLERAAKKGIRISHGYIGAALSPVSRIQYPVKDAKKALEELQKAWGYPFVLHEIAMLYYNGIGGIPLDEERAERLQAEAEMKASTENIRPIIEPLRKKKVFTWKSSFIPIFVLLLLYLFIKMPLADHNNSRSSLHNQKMYSSVLSFD